jgi:hypothetical protein
VEESYVGAKAQVAEQKEKRAERKAAKGEAD